MWSFCEFIVGKKRLLFEESGVSTQQELKKHYYLYVNSDFLVLRSR